MAEVSVLLGSLSLISKTLEAFDRTHKPNALNAMAPRIEYLTVLMNSLHTTLGSLDHAQLNDIERRMIMEVTKEGAALLEIAMVHLNPSTTKPKRGSILRRRLRYDSSIKLLSDNLVVFEKRGNLILNMLQMYS
jgi:hypothetical protein